MIRNNLEDVSALVREAIYMILISRLPFPEELHIQTEPIWANLDNFAITDESHCFLF